MKSKRAKKIVIWGFSPPWDVDFGWGIIGLLYGGCFV